MFNLILVLDQKLFLLINHLPHPPLLVFLAQIFSGIERWFIWFFIFIALIYFEKHHNKIIINFLVSVIGAGYLASGIIKPLVGRLRPEFLLPGISIYYQNSDYFAFPSGHAATAFAAAFVLSSLHPKAKVYFYLLASLIALSRVYLGVHYPLDIIFGALLGIGVGFFTLKLN